MAHGTGTHVIGSSGDDYLLGTDGDDIVADNYRGLSTRPTGNDTLVGGMGNDYLTAPDSPNDESSDVFVFGPGHGDDTIVGDFEQEDGAQDVIDLSDFGAKAPTWDQLSAQIHRSGDDVAIDLRDFGGGVIRIRWVEPEDLTASHFQGLSTGAPPAVSGSGPVLGTPGEDRLYGGPGNDVMSGGAGKDLLAGGDGDDLLLGGPDGSTLFGQGGADTFVFTGGQNWFMDFDPSQGDRIGGDAAYLAAHGNTQQVGEHLAIYFGEDPWDGSGPGTIWLASTNGMPEGEVLL